MSRLSSLTPCRSASPRPPVVQPDHFYGADTLNAPLSPHSDSRAWVTPDDDPLAHRGIPVFRPTMAEFEDFEEYMKAIECWGMRSGIVKVIPPKEWIEALPSVIPQLRDVAIGSPIEQHMLGRGGLFRQENLEKRKFMSVREWVELCNKDDFRAPGMRDVGLGSRSANVRAPVVRSRRGKKVDGMKRTESAGLGVVNIKQEAVDVSHQLGEASSVESSVVTPPSSVVEAKCQAQKTEDSEPIREKPKTRSRRGPTKEQKEANHARDLAFIDNFDPHKDWLPLETKASDYTPEFCQKLERTYWRNLGLGKPAWYGADTQGSLFTDATKSWNVAHLPSTLSRLLPSSANGLPGVNTPYLYFGMWRATFSWHVEDMDLFSINYIHFGAPKFWYAIPQGRACALEQTMRGYFPKDTSQCPEFLRHKSFLASPNILAQSSCRPNFLVQHAGEFVITYPRGYHAGLNLGLNCAESVNFALDSWIELGRKAKACKCISDSVRIDVDQLLRDREEEGQELELPALTNTVSKARKSGGKARSAVKKEEFDSDVNSDLSRTSRKRKSEGGEDSTKLKKIKIKLSPHKASTATLTSSKPPFPKISVTLKLPPRPVEPDAFPCCLCISMDREGLLKVHEPPIGKKEAAEAAGNPKIWMAHELCAKVVPETWVDEIELENVKQKMVFGVDGIVRDRWNLKCSACTKSRPKAHGAPVQCTKGKCPKAFHISCARENTSLVFSVLREVEKEVVLLEPSTVSNMQVDSANGTLVQELPQTGQVFKVIQKYDVQLLCSQHNPAVAAEKKASKQEKIKQDLLALPSMSRIKIRVSAGVFEVSLVRVIEEAGTVEVLWDRGLKKEFKWGSVVFGSTDGPVFSKPSEPAPESQVPQSIPSRSYISLPLRTPSYMTPSTPAATSIPATVSQPSTSYSVPYYPSSRPGYNYWPYGNHGGTTYTQYPYPYGSYYASVPGNTNSQYTPYLYAQNQYRGGQLQWQQPYQGPRISSTGLDQVPGSLPTSDQNQVTDFASTQTTSLPDTISQEHQVESIAETSSASPTNSSPPIDTPPSEGLGDSQQSFTLTPEMEQAILTNLQALSVMQPAQLAELLQSNPQLQTVLAVMNQTKHPASAS